MKCEKCQQENRSIAKFCRWCGQPLMSNDMLDKLVGLSEVKQQMKTVVDTYSFLRSRKDVADVRLSVNSIVIGETGTGKTLLAEIQTCRVRPCWLRFSVTISISIASSINLN